MPPPRSGRLFWCQTRSAGVRHAALRATPVTADWFDVRHAALITTCVTADGSVSDTLIATPVTADWFGVRHADSRPRNGRLVRCQTR
ncbi:MAG: hypothetical protein LBG05_09290 [Treponema sp.]|nr:hypothetical protein [Treponema sp.]